MKRIKQLSPAEAHKIAAGEVVDRPANVVKELVENAIDAGATQITVYIEQAGQQLIRVVDNGCGMSVDDARICIAQYATSKITSVDDLAVISTFGFRGEALASITAVSKTTLITKEGESDQGLLLEIEEGKIVKEAAVSCNTGTDIAIRDLFYNVPARKKFLKKPETEWRNIVSLAHAFCISYTSISFKFFHDDRQIIHCPAVETVMDRAMQLWDRTVSPHVIPLSIQDVKRNIRITGLISNHQYFRYDRSQIFFFVNNRWIKNYALGNALLKGYLNVIPPQRSPLAALFITVNQADIDVNIHPRKEEIQFLHPRVVEVLLQTAVKKALEEHLSAQIKKSSYVSGMSPVVSPPELRSDFDFVPSEPDSMFSAYLSMLERKNNPTEAVTDAPENEKRKNESVRELSTLSSIFTPAYQSPLSFDFNKPVFNDVSNTAQEHATGETTVQQQTVSVSEQRETIKTYQLIGQYKKTYLLLEQEDGLFLIDQHAAHERILYELFEHRFQEVATVALLFPHIVTLCEEDAQLMTPYLDLFNKNGILIELFGNNQFIVQSVPVHLKDCSYDDLIKEVVGWIKQERDVDHADLFKMLHEKMRAQMACKAAVKAGDELTWQQMETLLDDLSKTNNRFTCPHGRPTGWLLSLHDIEKKFKRKV